MESEYNWEKFWQEWHNFKAETEADLYWQVAKTVNKKPMKPEVFNLINDSIIDILGVTVSDNLIELCCGNGLCTFEFRNRAAQVIAVDFSHHLIEAAKEFKSAPNITYFFQDVIEFIGDFNNKFDFVPNKFLMNDSLAYFTPVQLESLLLNIVRVSNGSFRFLIRGVPNDDMKWNYYNTEERRAMFENFAVIGDATNNGMGRWWKGNEIKEVCTKLGLNCELSNQSLPISDYRMDALIYK